MRCFFASAASVAAFLGLSVVAGAAHADVAGAASTGAPAAEARISNPVLDAGAAALATVRPVMAVARGAPPPEVAQHLKDAAAAYVIDRNLLEAVAWRESRFVQGAKSNKGAAGIMQLMPGTAKDLGVDRHDARQNIFGGAAYLKELLITFGGDVSLALAAYNAGPGAVKKFGGVPPFTETRNYVTAITGRVAELAAAAVATPAAAATVGK